MSKPTKNETAVAASTPHDLTSMPIDAVADFVIDAVASKAVTDGTVGSVTKTDITDADVLPHLLDAMQAAGDYDIQALRSHLTKAGAILDAHAGQEHGFGPEVPHRAQAYIQRAGEAGDAGEWLTAWRLSWTAMTMLRYAWVPAQASCPPRPYVQTRVEF